MAASGAKYGIMTSHFYWVGAIPAMVFVGIFMMPFYYGAKARSVPEYLKLRFDEKTRGVQRHLVRGDDGLLVGHLACTRWALLFQPAARLGLRRQHHRRRRSIVLVYIFLGGLTSAIYNEVLQFFLIVFGFFAAVAARPARRSAGGPACRTSWRRSPRPAASSPACSPSPGSTWLEPSANPMGVEWFGMVMGLGFVLSFGYWCTDFLVVQRAMAANSMTAARRTPLIARRPEDVLPVPRDPAGHDRRGAASATAGLAVRGRQGRRLQPGAPDAAAEVSTRPGCWASG